MKALRHLSIVLLLVVMSVTCSDSNEPDVVTVADLVGTWTATRLQVTDPGGTVLPIPVDLVGPLVGGSLEITVAASGSFTGSFRASAGSQSIPVAGTVSISGNTLTIDLSWG